MFGLAIFYPAMLENKEDNKIKLPCLINTIFGWPISASGAVDPFIQYLQGGIPCPYLVNL
jgi:hypothetical protein